MATSALRRRRRSTYNLFPQWMTLKRSMAVLLIAMLVGGGIYGGRVVLALAKLTHQNALQVLGGLVSGGNGSAVEASAVNLKRINIALYGYGGLGHDGGYLTDSIMVVSIQPRAGGAPPQVAEISIPRDWYVPITLGNGNVDHERINFAYAAGKLGEGPVPQNQTNAGAAVADPELEKLLGIHIDHYAGIDFTAFKQGVDAVGGIDVNVPNTFTDYNYPAGECSGYRPVCGYITVHFNAGVQHMNGAQALEFSRSRHGNNGEGSDFARSHRQQLVVAAVKSKVVSLGGLGNLPDLLNAFGDNVATDLTVSDMEALYSLTKGVDPASVEHVSLDDTNFLYACGYPVNCGAYYLFAHDRTLETLQHFIQNVFLDPAAVAEKAPVTVIDGSGRGNGASTRWSALLSQLGLAATDGSTGTQTHTTEVIDNSGGKYSATAAWLARYFGVSVTKVAPPTAVTSSVTVTPQARGITLILGSDEEAAFNNLNGNATN